VAKQDSGGVGFYLKQIGKRPLLTKEQEIILSQKIEGFEDVKYTREPDGEIRIESSKAISKSEKSRAKNKMIESNLRLVVSIAKRFQNRGCSLDDLIAAGNIGLIRATELFDWRKGFRFSTYATWWIRQNIGREVASQSKQIKTSGRVTDVYVRIQLARDEFIELHAQEPTCAELASIIGVTETTVQSAISGIPLLVSIDKPIGSDGADSRTLKDVIEDVDSESPLDLINKKELTALLSGVLNSLNPREEKILRMRFGLTENPKDHKKFPISSKELEKMKASCA